ncbi:BC1881 family protein [Tyzzerella sp. An114]|uniref:BC1881 family protein n=1 Tax=Tyzzerella sp. An114 TaxID=1965545 RepID=UPI001FA8DE16|nr:BC1881 family protein [Tyzzerella sp. An114]
MEKIIRKTIDEYTTYELIEELYRREGVEKHIAEPYKDVNVEVNGPAIILIVID